MITTLYNKKAIAVVALACIANFASAPDANAARGAGNSENSQESGQQSAGNTSEAGGRCCDGGNQGGQPSGGKPSGEEPSVSTNDGDGGSDPQPGVLCGGQWIDGEKLYLYKNNALYGTTIIGEARHVVPDKGGFAESSPFLQEISPTELSRTFSVQTNQHITPPRNCAKAIMNAVIEKTGIKDQIKHIHIKVSERFFGFSFGSFIHVPQ